MRRGILILFLTITFTAGAQSQRKLAAQRIHSAPKIDALLNDSCWSRAEIASDFIQTELQPGTPSARRSEVRVLYDDEAIYIGALLYDISGDSVLRELSVRDMEANSDQFAVSFDTYNDDINAFAFVVTAAGTQIDLRISNQGWDTDWNAVWASCVKVHDQGWTVEMKIPYSALRFPKKDIQDWGFNVMRSVRRIRELSYWNYVDPKIDAVVRQSGALTNIENIKAPPRLSFSPYVAGIAENNGSDSRYNMSGGMDVKYGISDAFTLDMTLVPDFSQVQSDNQVLNLSPFEVQFQERRPFFTEGTELFNIGGLFYSRRVGGTPINYYDGFGDPDQGEKTIRNPSQTQLLNATKVSGRTRSKLGLGLFNALANESEALIETPDGGTRKVLTSPLTNYNIVVLDQAMKNNSSVNFINTNVTRRGDYHNANVSGAGLQLNDKTNTYFIYAAGALSSRFKGHFLNGEQGYSSGLSVGKNGGNFRWTLFNNIKSDGFNPNDLGLQQLGNNIESGIWMGYHIFKPFWKVNNMYNNLTFMYQRMYNPDAFWNFGIYGNHNTTFKKRFLTCGFNYGAEPIPTFDYYETRDFSRFYRFPVNYSGGGFISSDYRKPFALDIWASHRIFRENNRNNHNISISPRYRASNRLSFVFEVSRSFRNDDVGYANRVDDDIIFTRRDVETVGNIFSTVYKFTTKMSLSFRMRHYWSKADYIQYYLLEKDGSLGSTDYSGQHSVSFNAFNIDMVFFWQFAPGSELNVVWKQSVLGVDRDYLPENYIDNVNRGFSSPQSNMLSVKVLYYFDYLMAKKLVKRSPKAAID
jgi:hypothetical protein